MKGWLKIRYMKRDYEVVQIGEDYFIEAKWMVHNSGTIKKDEQNISIKP
jgi:hypothetical protein